MSARAADRLRLSRGMALLGHRGVRAGARENTLEAFERAVELGADGVEFDLRRTRDGVWVLHHDRTFWKGGRLRTIARRRAKDLPGWMPRVADLLAWADRHPRAILDAELKVSGGVKRLLEALAPLRNRTLVTSFFPSALRQVRRYGPGFSTGLIAPSGLEDNVALAQACGARFLVWRERYLKKPLALATRRAGLGLIVWDVATPARLRELKRWGARAVITDHLQSLRRADA